MGEKRAKSSGRMVDTVIAGDVLGVSHRTLERWRKKTTADGRPKGPPFYSVEGQIRYDMRELEEYKASCRREPGEDGFAA